MREHGDFFCAGGVSGGRALPFPGKRQRIMMTIGRGDAARGCAPPGLHDAPGARHEDALVARVAREVGGHLLLHLVRLQPPYLRHVAGVGESGDGLAALGEGVAHVGAQRHGGAFDGVLKVRTIDPLHRQQR